ncbi:hypothetical protein D3C71_382420 [compost metagenome]
MDLADVIEETRKLKRRLCSADIGLTTEDVFGKPFLDYDHLIDLRNKLQQYVSACARSDHEARELLSCMDKLADKLSGNLVRPSDDELCGRFSSGSIDARTVLDITGWSVDELYDNCERRGLPTAM